MLRRSRGGPRNYPHNGDDFDVIGPDEKIIGRVMKPGGRAEHWLWALKMVVRQQLRGSGTAPTREEGQRRSVRRGKHNEESAGDAAHVATELPPDYGPARDGDRNQRRGAALQMTMLC